MSVAIVTIVVASLCANAWAADDVAVPQRSAASVLNRYCIDCHSADSAERNARLDLLPKLALDERLALLNRAQEQLLFGLMPPDDADQPSEPERTRLANWLRDELRKHNASKLDDKLRYPDYGNYVAHERLFSGEIKSKAYTPARRWLVSPQIFHERVVDVFNLTNETNIFAPQSTNLVFNFDGTVQSGLGDPRQIQVGARLVW